jgi:hypothetical protein
LWITLPSRRGGLIYFGHLQVDEGDARAMCLARFRLFPRQVRQVAIVFRAHVLQCFPLLRPQRLDIAHLERFLERAGVVVSDFHFQMPQVRPSESLRDVQLLGLRNVLGETTSGYAEPAEIVEANRVDHQRVAVPVPDGVSHPGRVELLGMLAAVEINQASRIKAAIDDHHQVGRLNELVFLNALCGNSPWQAKRGRRKLVRRLPPLGDCFGRGQQLGRLPDGAGKGALPDASYRVCRRASAE